MHEWSVAYSIIRTVMSWAGDKEVLKVTIGIPSFSFLDLDILKDAFNEMKKDSGLSNAELEVKIKDPTFKCRNCGYIFTISEVSDQLQGVREEFGEEYPLHLMPALAPSFIRCPKCGSHDVIAQAEDITIDEIVVKESGAVKTTS
ncbi:hydrogenase/urease maturation nickel metallochaperone HypA [Acidianus sp. RZ1]|uniref:hydrogenase/urease maturation nickel metallochaperone HypA n=1 Tax=Acidianus sp. RZ1 TaxID=1540082 RepID=UPI001491968D|nr:hydrogenase/urease maturation nickel metallochaperone HypA [Acidianus sp. RZ1]NON62532.1 hydrogenase maturation nickel metallochaperone HypA [Acidianus sp. RZ1]